MGKQTKSRPVKKVPVGNKSRPDRQASVGSKKRLLVVMIAIFVLFGGVAAKMGYIVFAQGEALQEKALLQQTSDEQIAPQRGSILDCNGNTLAQSANAQTVVVRPEEIMLGNVDAIVSKLSQTLGIDEETVRKKATDESKTEVWLARQIRKETALELQKLGLPGVYFTTEIKRYYPNSAFLTQTLGFTSVDGDGLEGLEAYFETELSGTPGRVVSETDERGREIPLGVKEYIAPQEGENVVLTVDEVIQSFLENALEDAMTATVAVGASGVVMNPKTGEVLAIANLPDYDLNEPPRSDAAALSLLTRNRAITEAISPGTLMQVFTAAAAIDNGAAADTQFECSGCSVVNGEPILCWSYPQAHGPQTMGQALQTGCRSAFIEIGRQLGTQGYYDYLRAFGFGKETGITFPSDQGGSVLAEKYVQQSDLARLTYGQSIAVSPLQTLSSLCAVVNGGFLYRPMLVKALETSDGTMNEYESELLAQPISAEASAVMRQMLAGVVDGGLGSGAYIPGYKVGGMGAAVRKTDEDGEEMETYRAMFTAFAPADDPQIALLIVLDEPQDDFAFGCTSAAPAAQSVLLQALQYTGVSPDYEAVPEKMGTAVPDVVGKTAEEAITALAQDGFVYLTDGGGSVTAQVPAAGMMAPQGTVVRLYMDTPNEAPQTEGMVMVPDISGMTIMQASLAMADARLVMTTDDGRGVVTDTLPAAGELVPAGSEVVVSFFLPRE